MIYLNNTTTSKLFTQVAQTPQRSMRPTDLWHISVAAVVSVRNNDEVVSPMLKPAL